MAETMQSLDQLAALKPAAPEAPKYVQKLDGRGRAYATGKRKNAVARVWIKPGAGRVTVNEKPVSIASFQVRPGDIVQVREKSRKQLRIQCALNVAQQVGLPEWVEVNDKEFRGLFKSAPGRDEVLPDINENLVVELYSK